MTRQVNGKNKCGVQNAEIGVKRHLTPASHRNRMIFPTTLIRPAATFSRSASAFIAPLISCPQLTSKPKTINQMTRFYCPFFRSKPKVTGEARRGRWDLVRLVRGSYRLMVLADGHHLRTATTCAQPLPAAEPPRGLQKEECRMRKEILSCIPVFLIKQAWRSAAGN
jgi:hypothetical protein